MVGAERLQRLALQLQRRARPPLAQFGVPLLVGSVQIGTVEPRIADFLRDSGWCVGGTRLKALVVDDGRLDVAARSARLAAAAEALHVAGLLTGWRGETLDVRAEAQSVALAGIERAACRPLGIATTAVHLNAYFDDDTLVVAQRAPDKQIDPGLWDNLVGGMVPAGESLEAALLREAWEEAGLRLADHRLQPGRWFEVRRPVSEGLQAEAIHVFDVFLAPTLALANQDGEVAAIEARSVASVIDAIERGEFTLEAALATLESVMRRRKVPAPPGLYH
jgi:8-oxo-dGTP pyrophosphatase MutT (NUDIX family)